MTDPNKQIADAHNYWQNGIEDRWKGGTEATTPLEMIHQLANSLSLMEAEITRLSSEARGLREEAEKYRVELRKIADFTEIMWRGVGRSLEAGWIIEEWRARAFDHEDDMDTLDVAARVILALSQRVDELQKACRTRADYNLRCQDCGAAHNVDTSLPSHIWNQIAKPEDVLCTLCIDERLQRAGLTCNEAEFYYVGTALRSKPYKESHGQLAALARRVVEACAKLFCRDCAAGIKVEAKLDGRWFHRDGRADLIWPCEATRIYRLDLSRLVAGEGEIK